MGLYVSAEARCSHCGTRAPCELKLYFWGTKAIGSREYGGMSGSISGLENWFQKDDGLACSPECRDVLAKDPRFADYNGQWKPCR